ncbi:Tyrosine-protein kinase YwqD [Planococcus massiliensis]|uniref:non-specific protein-tyrosine kinase n=1 Tax=Planococcus massiliensis TaxID=1499687 RepID=A0A098EIN2_9BACL|nr:CpsD/CapB family tyrosine-protein kinase [Planococcus massiliensis]CEG22154.1 Tyrosine-protein kinase YwqD [Planococcus massiliensis]
MGIQKKTKHAGERKRFDIPKTNSLAAEQYRSIRTNLNFTMPDSNVRTILFTSATNGEGKTTTALNIAIVYAESGKKVLLVDGNMRRPALHHFFDISSRNGFSSLLMKKGELLDTVKRTGIVGLEVLPCGHVPSNPAELLGAAALEQLMAEMKKYYDIVIFDSAPVLTIADSKILANKCDGTVLVASSGKSDKQQIVKAKEALLAAKATILGVILNNHEVGKSRNYYEGYHSD